MLPYIFILIFAYYFAKQIDKQRKTDPKKANQQKWWLILVLTVFLGLRYGVGSDYFAYIHDYNKWKSLTWSEILLNNEPIIRLIAKICHLIYVPHFVPVHFFLILAFAFVSTSICSIYKFSRDFTLSIVLFILCGSYLDSCNASRQCIAAGIFFANYENIRQQKLAHFLILTFVASLFHTSVITLLPLYFVFAPNLPKEKQILWLLCTASLLFVSFSSMMNYTEKIMNKELADDVTYFNTRVSLLRVLVFLMPCLLILQKRQLTGFSFPIFVIFIVFNAIMALVTFRSAYLMRVCIYTNIFLCLALPDAIHELSLSKKNTDAVLKGMLVFYFIFWIYGILKSGGVYPYRCVLFN